MTLKNSKKPKAIQDLLKNGSSKEYLYFLKFYHEADIAEQLASLTENERSVFFKKVNLEVATNVLEELDIEQQIDFISKLKTEAAAKFIEEMEPDDAVDLLEELSETNQVQAEKIIDALPEKEKIEIQTLLSYDDGSAGSLMTSDYLSIPEDLTTLEALKQIQNQNPPDSEVSFYIFIVSESKKLIGYTTLKDLVFSSKNLKVKSIRHEHNIFVNHQQDQEEVAKLFQKYDMSVVPVIDENEKLLGVITIDDVVDVVVEEANEDIYKLSGTATDDEKKIMSTNIFTPIFYRIPWLIITIIGGIIASNIINSYSSIFNTPIFPLALSLSFIPLLMGLGGNVGNQSSAIIVRGLATGYINPKESLKILLREVTIGIGIGIIISGILFIVNKYFYTYPLIFSFIVTLSLFLNILVAAFIGTTLPLLFHKLKIDPAIASAPFISTTLDIIGQLIYFFITISLVSNYS
tara:strand:+ start:1155 stop:2543 length:1389 start_codon:yes stop_codon:yes gene_type:complete